MLLRHGANPNAIDIFKGCALWDACRGGHDACIQILRRHGGRCETNYACFHTSVYHPARQICCQQRSCNLFDVVLLWHCRLVGHSAKNASVLCAAVADGDLMLLRRLLLAGADANDSDYDDRTALHIACAEGNVAAVRNRGC